MTAATGPAGLDCPACGEPPRWLFCDTQAVCGTGGWLVFTWDPTKSRAELNADSGVIDLPFGEVSGG